MGVLKWLLAGLVALLAGVLGLVGFILSVTLILLPLGIPVLMLAKKLYGVAAALVVPRAVRHPFDELDKKGSKAKGEVGAKAGNIGKVASKATGRGRTWYGRKRKSPWQKALDWVTS